MAVQVHFILANDTSSSNEVWAYFKCVKKAVLAYFKNTKNAVFFYLIVASEITGFWPKFYLISDIWRTLIAQRNSETDEIMQIHIQEALDQVNQIVKKLFQPNNELKKTIYVLDQPPDPFI